MSNNMERLKQKIQFFGITKCDPASLFICKSQIKTNLAIEIAMSKPIATYK
jgi:hypothetical protein